MISIDITLVTIFIFLDEENFVVSCRKLTESFTACRNANSDYFNVLEDTDNNDNAEGANEKDEVSAQISVSDSDQNS